MKILVRDTLNSEKMMQKKENKNSNPQMKN